MRSPGELQETWEELLFALLYKMFRSNKNLVIVRASEYDYSTNNGVDTLMTDLSAGRTICGLRPLVSQDAVDLEKGLPEIQKLNASGGADLKYGLKVEPEKSGSTGDENGTSRRLIPGRVGSVPVFLAPITWQSVETGLKLFSSNPDEISDWERETLARVLEYARAQVEFYKIMPNLDDKLEANILRLEEILLDITQL